MVGKTMKSVVVRKEIANSEIVEVPIPEPKGEEVLIRVVCTDSNPKDWKMVSYTGKEYNTGDDIAGIVEAVGPDVYEFQPGQRVGAFHVMMDDHGSYAEYAIAPQSTVFAISPKTTFEEAATVPLAAMTSAFALRNLGLPDVFNPAPSGSTNPVLIYGGSTAIGAFAIKIAKQANIHPIIAVAGAGCEFVKSLGADVVIDYRKDNVVEDIRKAIGDDKLLKAYDCVSEPKTFETVAKALDKGGILTHILPAPEDFKPDGVELVITNVGMSHDRTYMEKIHGTQADRDFAFAMFRWFGRALADGRFSGHPQKLVDGGLSGIGGALKQLMDGEISAAKFVYRLADDQ